MKSLNYWHSPREKSLGAARTTGAGKPSVATPHRPAFSKDVPKALRLLYNLLTQKDMFARGSHMTTWDANESFNSLV